MTKVRNEAELCELFSDAARSDGWNVYPETEGWDLLLVWRGENTAEMIKFSVGAPAGYQIGVEAKMRANCEVIDQAAMRMTYSKRPDAGAVLVPGLGKGWSAFRSLAASHLGLLTYDLANCESHSHELGYEVARKKIWPPYRHRFTSPAPSERVGPVALPPIPLQSAGGCASPRTLSKWRVGSLRLVIALDERGHITNADFKAQGVDKRLWVERGWIVGEGRGASARYLPGPRLRDGGPVTGYQAELDALRAHDARGAA